MKEIVNFLKTVKHKITDVVTPEVPYFVKFVMGNTTCDMDSFLTSIVYSYFKNVESGIITFKKDNEYDISYNIYDMGNIVYIPILNCSKEDLFHRLDIAELCKLNHLSENDFFFYKDEFSLDKEKDELVFKSLIYSKDLLESKYFILYIINLK